ncbi:cytochrome c [Ferruginibacter sp.]|uniref:c-type cytochrome n=1 Tax=Ferruginibacter sp. TaxID=1940288 RepID=UPI002659FEBB|nr:cytochrome c [Ferruginibacter sp.]
MNKQMTISLMVSAIVFTAGVMPNQNLSESIKRGKEVYALQCQNCHMEDGTGIAEVNPPLAKTAYMKKPNKTLINIILKGQAEEITVNGKKYNIAMPAQDYLTDEQIADVLNYCKNSWGNKIPAAVTPAMVKALRQ